ncbi:putative solute-binding protein [ANME-1 cluster archaeon GoMg2]|nr:putative solute-binding protein [ANME-1 cluster archaeon GoMg2]
MTWCLHTILRRASYADEITPDNWYEILRRDGVVFAFSNPNLDPCGYRAVMVCQLAELYSCDNTIFDDLILDNTAITISEEGGTYLIKTPEDMKPNTEKVSIRPKSVELVAMVEVGGLDYAFEYRSVAVQHNLSYVDLPLPIDLSSVEYADVYKKVKLETVDGKTKTGKPIVYGITVPKNAENPELGLEFVEFVIGDAGQKIFADMGQPPIVPPIGSGEVPEELKGMVNLVPTPSQTPTISPTAVPSATTMPSATASTSPTSQTPGFEAIFAVTALLAVMCLLRIRRKV